MQRATSTAGNRRWLGGALALCIVLQGCGSGKRETKTAGVPKPPQRIIVLAPSLTETAFALGLGDRIVGVSDYSQWPAEVKEKPHLGGLLDPHLEQIATLHPDLAILLPSQDELGQQLQGMGIETLTLRDETIQDVVDGIHAMAVRCQVPVAGARQELRLRHALAPNPLPAAPKVLLVVGRQSGSLRDLTAAGPDTFLAELLSRLGARNAAADSPTRYPRLGLDAVVAAAPEVIIELQGHHLWEINERDLVRDWRPLHTIPAVRNGCVKVVAGDWALLPGPRLPELYTAMRRAIAECIGPG